MDKPQTVCGDLYHLPDVLAPLIELAHWVLWKWEAPKHKWTKVPYQPNGRKAKNNDPSTWNSYDTTIAALEHGKWDGIGFCILGSNIAAFDIDKCRDPVSGKIDPWAEELVARAGSYTEITVSGTGLRIIGHGNGVPVQRKLPVNGVVSCEPYRNCERYIVMTGNPLPNAPLQLVDIDAVIDATLAELDAQKAHKEENNKPGTPDDGGQHASQDTDDSDELERLIREGERGQFQGDRSKAVWSVVNELLRRGYLPETIVIILLDRKNGISAHIYDQQNPRKYAERQVAEAKIKIEFLANDNGVISRTNPENICVALLKMNIELHYDHFADRTLINGLANFGPTLEDAAVDRIWLQMGQRFRFRPNKELLHTVARDIARLNGFHPVVNYLVNLQWDGKRRIDKWLTTYGGAEDNEYTEAVGALMLVAAVRRVRQPGCKFDEMLVLENPSQGTDKSTALRTLAVRDEWFTDDMPLNIEGKRVIEALRGRWIVECAELSGMRRADIEHVKAQLSRQIDRARMAYAHIVSEVPRQCVFFGTTNSVEFLGDTTGNRRFWPVRVGTFKVDVLRRDRDQLWAEAAAREASNASIRLDPKLWPLAAEEQEKRLTSDPWYETLHAKLNDMEGKIAMESVWLILGIPGAQQGQTQSLRVGEAMRKLGFKRANKARTVKIASKLVSGFVKGEQPWRTVVATRLNDGRVIVSYDDVL